MARGDVFPGRKTTITDPLTGVTVHQLTGDACHAAHVYFTHSGWHDGGERLLVCSDRSGSGNLYSLEISSGDMRQLTAYEDGRSRYLPYSLPTPDGRSVLVSAERWVVKLDLESLAEEELYRVPEGWSATGNGLTCDGTRFLLAMRETLPGIHQDMGNDYVGFREVWAAHPDSRIVAIDVASGAVAELWSESEWIGHVNPCPTDPGLLTFCHEGPWDDVDHRLWLLRIGETPRKLGDHRTEGVLGHEYWHDDGAWVGYHGHRPDLGSMVGHVRVDDGEWFEASIPGGEVPPRPWHVSSRDAELLVTDAGARTVQLWHRDGDGYEARDLCTHRGSFHSQRLHVHPRFNADGSQVLFTSDRTGYGQVQLAEVPQWESLPKHGG